MARSAEMIIHTIKWIHAGHRRLQEFRIRFAVTHSHLSKPRRYKRCKRIISEQMVFDTRLVRKEDHVELRVARCDGLLQLLQDSKSQFDALTISLGHDDVGLQILMLLLPKEGVDQFVEAFTGNVPNAAFPIQVAKEAVNSAVANMIVVQDQLAAIQREIRLEIRVLLRIEIIFDIIVQRKRQHDLVDIEILAFEQVKQILLIRSVTGDTAVDEFVVRSIDLRSGEEFLLTGTYAPNVRIAEHENSLSRGRLL